MTGLTTGHTPIRGNKEWQPEGQWPIPAGTYTVAEMHQETGYNCQRLAQSYYTSHLWDNQGKVILEGNLGDQFGQYAPVIKSTFPSNT